MEGLEKTASELHWQQLYKDGDTCAYTSPDCHMAWAMQQADHQPARLAFFNHTRLIFEVMGTDTLLDRMADSYMDGTLLPFAIISLDVTPEQWCHNRRTVATDAVEE